MHIADTIRTKYHSGLYSNTELVIEFAPYIGALEVLKILNYTVVDDIRPDLKDRILDMPKVHEIYSQYHRELRQSISEIEGTPEASSWKDREFAIDKKRIAFKLNEALRAYPWVTKDLIDKLYHD